MEYIVPAWHNQLTDWAYNIPQIEFYDGITHMQILQDNGRKVGLVLTDYQPQMTTKLNKYTFFPDYVFSVYDYLQGIHNLQSQILDFRDFNWPEDVIFDFTPFRIQVLSQNRLYAQITFDTQGKLLYIQYLGENGQQSKRLVMDSRGFISSVEEGNEVTYFDEAGHWRFVHNKQTDEVKINPYFNYFAKLKYDHIKDLITEIFTKVFLKNVKDQDHLIVTVDDQSTIDYDLYQKYQPIFTVNKREPYEASLVQVKAGQLLVPSKCDQAQIEPQIAAGVQTTVMPFFPIRVKLGHSQRIKRQVIAIFAENMSEQDLKQIVNTIYPYLLNNPKGWGLHFLSYSTDKDGMIGRVISQFKTEHRGEFTTENEVKEQGEMDSETLEKRPVLYLKQDRLTSTAVTFKILDKIRLLINWGKSDDFIQTTAISIGIPQLQNFESATLIDRGNGMLYHNMVELQIGLNWYLNSLKHWNQALVYDVKLLNKYSEENLMKIWSKVLGLEGETDESSTTRK